MGLEVDGLKPLLAKLDEMGDDAERIKRKALRKGAEPVQRQMKNNVNRTDINGENYTHIQDDIKISIKDNTAEIGPGKKTRWKANFLENGTSKMSPHPFIERSLHESKREVLQAIKNELKKGLKLR